MAIVSFLQTFNVQLPLPVLSMTDNSDYYGQGINPNTITGSFKITLDGNVVLDHLSTYNTGSADIVGATSLTTQGVLQMALNPSGSAANGLYTILYKVWDSNTSTTSIITETFNFIYGSPTVVINGTVDVVSPLLTQTDNTTYVVNGATPTFISKNASIIYPQVIVPSNPIPFTPTPTVNTGTNPITTSNLFYAPCTVTMSVLSNISYSFPASGTNTSFTVVDKISGQIPFPIDDTNNCNLICGLNNYWKNWVLPNPNNDEYYETYCYLASLYVTLTGLQGCGEPDGVDTLIAEMNATAGFSDCCSCCTQGVHQVVGIGGLVNIYDVQSANSYITVTPVVSGNTKTFTIELSVAFVTLVNSILGATLVAGDNIVLSSSTSGANTTWTINALGVTVVSANESITVTPTATGNNTEYDLSLKTYAQTQLTTVTLSAPSTDYAIFGTPIQVSEAGTYMMFFEADLTSTGLLDMNAQYHPYKNSAPTVNISTFGSTDIRVVANSFPSTTTIEKITMNTTVNLLRLDTINININAGTLSATGYITKASILLIKIG